MGKSGPTCLNLFLLGLGWPWVGAEFRRFHSNIYIFPTQQNLVNRKRPGTRMHASETDGLGYIEVSLPHLLCNRRRGTRQECGNPGLETQGYNALTPAVAHACPRFPLRNLAGQRTGTRAFKDQECMRLKRVGWRWVEVSPQV